VTITGGKFTTWRRMAKSAVDRIVEREGREAPCRTHEIQIGQPEDPGALPEVPGVDEESRAHLAARYGHAARDVLRLAVAAPQLASRITPDLPDLVAECAFAAGHEQARSVADVLLRRTRVGLLAGRALAHEDDEGLRRVAAALAAELNWTPERTAAEVASWAEVAQAEGVAGPPAQAAAPRETAAPRESSG
jgi:glycerol-3-phosphate dehydrogenase